MKIDLLEQWIAFSRRLPKGARLWIADSLFDRLWDRIGADARWHPDCFGAPRGYAINFRGSYKTGGVTFYPRKAYRYLRVPDPPDAR